MCGYAKNIDNCDKEDDRRERDRDKRRGNNNWK